jgi:Mg-chelatase subunit ChlD
MKLKKFLTLAAAAGSMVLASSAIAATSVAWLAPPNNSAFPAGSIQAPVGQASASGVVGGTGLDLALVIDTSGSMGGAGITNAKAAATALVNALPQNTTSVSVIQFSSSANTVLVLTALNPSKASVLAAINGLGTGGGTNIGSGIDKATSELNGPNATAGRVKQMVVLSDGFSSGTPANNAAAAVAAGINAVHSVGIPGHDAATMQSIATSGNGIYTNVSDLSQLENLFNGTSGNLVGIDHVDLIEPDGTVHANYPIDGLGNFTAPNYPLAAGPNTWTATAYDSLGNSASAQLTLIGTVNQTPDGGSSLVLLGLGLAGLFVSRRK